MELGKYNDLKILRFTSVGAYLGDESENEVLLPNKYLSDDMELDDVVCVFLYRDSEDRMVATTETPFLTLNDFAYLKVTEVNYFGAFVNWGLEKELMIPFKEQKAKLEEDRYYLIHLGLDTATDRLFGSAKVEKYFEECREDYDIDQKVQLLICEETDLGNKVVVNNKYQGLIFNSDISKELKRGEKTIGYISKVREDGKIDVRLEVSGYQKVEFSSNSLLDKLISDKEVFLTDKSSPEEIRSQLGMSKKTFKQSVGKLYKERLIEIDRENGKLVYIG